MACRAVGWAEGVGVDDGAIFGAVVRLSRCRGRLEGLDFEGLCTSEGGAFRMGVDELEEYRCRKSLFPLTPPQTPSSPSSLPPFQSASLPNNHTDLNFEGSHNRRTPLPLLLHPLDPALSPHSLPNHLLHPNYLRPLPRASLLRVPPLPSWCVLPPGLATLSLSIRIHHAVRSVRDIPLPPHRLLPGRVRRARFL